MYVFATVCPVAKVSPLNSSIVSDVSLYQLRKVPAAVRPGIGLPSHAAVSIAAGAAGIGLMVNITVSAGLSQLFINVSVCVT